MAKEQQPRPLHEMFPPVTINPAGENDQEKQAKLIAARQSPGLPVLQGLIAHSLSKKTETVLLDYTREAVGVRYQVDGVWHNIEPRDRQSGDAMLAVAKQLAGLNPNDRRARQEGKFGIETNGVKYNATLTTQGTQTGERALLKMVDKKAGFEKLAELGMRDKMVEKFKEVVNQSKGFIVISAMPGNGVTTSWNVALNASDRFMRDFVSIEDEANPEEEVINIEPVYFNAAAGESPADKIPGLVLKEVNVFVVPDLKDAKTMKALCDLVNNEENMAITRVKAKECAEALLRVLMFKGPAKDFAQAVTLVLNSRLVRKLCEKCKQAYPAQPQLLQRLGIPPGRVKQLYREWQPPPPEQRVDEKGRPIEIPICQECGGIGYRGRTAIFEMLVVDDNVRQALVKQPKLDVIRNAARQAGCRSLQEEGILLVARGVTSLTELQRVLKQ